MNWSLAPGDVLAHYRVVSPLGSGGMGQVYLAEDVRLGRKLALKVLSPHALRDPERLRRFEREARTISSLNHPNILTIYDIGDSGGVQFIATEYIDGLTLRAVLERGRLDVRRALDIALQVGQALAAAHAAGVIHRDVKPENVMVRADGYVKVLDFGLVKLASQESAPDATVRTELVDTKEGLVMGSVSYMAPEQARGGDIDARVDLFAFGIVLYEMLAGEPPFKGATVADVLGALLFKDPQPLRRVAPVPVQLDRIVATALRKDRNQRYQTVAHLLADLRAVIRVLEMRSETGWAERPSTGEEQTSAGFAVPALKGVRKAAASRSQPTVPHDPTHSGPPHDDSGVAPLPPRRRRAKRVIDSLAVLPLVNQSQDQELDYLSDGLTESLINNLSQIPRLRVMARSTVFRYKGQNTDPRIVGRQLDVKAVLTGHLRQQGNDFIVGAELVDVDDGAQLWGTLLNRRPSDVFVLQAEISRELTDALRLRLTRDEKSKLVKPHTVNAVAYQAYLRGRYFLNQRTVDALRESRGLFERAVAEDPQYALAYAGLADCCSLLAVSYRTPSLSGLIEQARTAAQTALALDEGLAEGHASLAFIKFRFDWDWHGADAAFKRALDLNLLSLIIQTGIGRILHFAGRYDEALLQYEHVLQTNPGFAQTRIDLALTRMARAEYAAAREELDLAEGLFGSVSTIVLLKGTCAVREGHMDEGREAFKALEERYARATAGPDDLALMAAVLGDWPLARHWLNEACAQRAPFLGYVDVEPAMAPLYQDPACRALLQRYGFGFT
jgi:serine/threonine protein kinase/tetratricopeptide (TPR) repeat protein